LQAGVQECVEPVDQVRVQEMEAEIRRLRMKAAAWRHRAEAAAGVRRRVVGTRIPQVFDRSRQTYGCRPG